MNKKELRKELITVENKEAADAAIFNTLINSELYKKANNIFTYISTPSEPDTYKFIIKALNDNKQISVPKSFEAPIMKAIQITDLNNLTTGRYGIQEPTDNGQYTDPQLFDLIIVPCVRVARDGYRLGHGKGYYDHYLKDITCPTVCLAYKEYLTDELETEEHDIPVDYIITDMGLIDCKENVE